MSSNDHASARVWFVTGPWTGFGRAIAASRGKLERQLRELDQWAELAVSTAVGDA